jgi:hypothetical protein
MNALRAEIGAETMEPRMIETRNLLYVGEQKDLLNRQISLSVQF